MRIKLSNINISTKATLKDGDKGKIHQFHYDAIPCPVSSFGSRTPLDNLSDFSFG